MMCCSVPLLNKRSSIHKLFLLNTLAGVFNVFISFLVFCVPYLLLQSHSHFATSAAMIEDNQLQFLVFLNGHHHLDTRESYFFRFLLDIEMRRNTQR